MSKDKSLMLEHLARLDGKDLSSHILELSEGEIKSVVQLVDNILEKERAGLDKFFNSVSQTLKYLPNFLILALTNKYIDAPIAARITSKLPTKQVTNIARGLDAEYLGEAAVFMEPETAAIIIKSLPTKNAKGMILYMLETHPLSALDIFSHADKRLFKLVSPPSSFSSIDTDKLNETRQETFNRFI